MARVCEFCEKRTDDRSPGLALEHQDEDQVASEHQAHEGSDQRHDSYRSRLLPLHSFGHWKSSG